MLKGIIGYLSRRALATTASHVERHGEDVLQRWIENLQVDVPRYCSSLARVKEHGGRSLSLLLSAIRYTDMYANPEHTARIVEMGRDIATRNLAEGLTIEETLGALSLFRFAVLQEFRIILRRRLWIALLGDVLMAEEYINRAIDMQMLAVAQAYLDVRDTMLRQNSRELEATNEQLLRLHDLSKAVASSLNLETALDSIADAVTKLLDSEICAIALVEKGTGQLSIDPRYGQRGLSPETVAEFSRRAAEVLGSEVLGAGNVRMLANVGEEAAPYPREWSEIGSIVCAPLKVQERTLGVIYVADRRPRHFDLRAAKMLVTLANHAAIALDNARLYNEAQQRSEVLATLMQEMHHRIKNNLHTVVDLLTLQGQQQGCARAVKCLGDSIGRVKSIAAVHELLSADNISQTDIKKLALRLAEISTKSKMRSGQRIRVIVEGASIYLPSKQATCLALVLNELLDNAIEHAFPNGDEGEVSVHLGEDGPEVVVVVKDGGVGLEEGFSPKRSKGLGLAIAVNLVEKDLVGSLTFNGTNGTEATIRFCK